MSKEYYLYIITNRKAGVLYVGITNDLLRRIQEHKQGKIVGFSSKYHLYRLVYFTHTNSIDEAIRSEKRIKRWKREWKIALIEGRNPDWKDLYNELV